MGDSGFRHVLALPRPVSERVPPTFEVGARRVNRGKLGALRRRKVAGPFGLASHGSTHLKFSAVLGEVRRAVGIDKFLLAARGERHVDFLTQIVVHQDDCRVKVILVSVVGGGEVLESDLGHVGVLWLMPPYNAISRYASITILCVMRFIFGDGPKPPHSAKNTPPGTWSPNTTPTRSQGTVGQIMMGMR